MRFCGNTAANEGIIVLNSATREVMHPGKSELTPPADVSFRVLSGSKFMLLQPKNWCVFQHYKNRCPPWIKLHRDLLNDRNYLCLPLASKALAPLLWLLAAESKDGIFFASFEELEFRLRLTNKEIRDGLSPLIDKGFFQVASGVLATCLHHASAEGEGEGEGEESFKETTSLLSVAKLADCPHGEILKLWEKHLPHLTQPRTWDGARARALKARWVQASKKSEWSKEGYTSKEDGLRFWDSFFSYISKETTLPEGFRYPTGRVWMPDLPWVVGASNFAKIVDFKYHKE